MKNRGEQVQVLVATMHQQDFSKVEQMKVTTDVLLANQTNRTEFQEKQYATFKAEMISTQTRGVGINRNMALAYAHGDILLMADDDMTYYPGYEEMVRHAFETNPKADAVIFNIDLTGDEGAHRRANRVKRVRIYNALNYGTVRIAVRRQSLVKSRIMFSTCFGGGTHFSSGEDTTFLCDMLRKGFRIYTSPDTIALVDVSESTWFHGYDEKYFYDKGALFYSLFPRTCSFFFAQYLVRHPKTYKGAGLTLWQALAIMKKGAAGYRDLKPYSKTDT